MTREQAERVKDYASHHLQRDTDKARAKELNTMWLLADQRLCILDREDPVEARADRARAFLRGEPDAATRERVEQAKAALRPGGDESVRDRARAATAFLRGEREAERRFGRTEDA